MSGDSAVDELLTELWCHTLRVAQIRPDDNFLSLGGDSIMMIMVIERVNEELGVKLGPAVLFNHPVFRDFRQLVLEERAHGTTAVDADIDEGVI